MIESPTQDPREAPDSGTGVREGSGPTAGDQARKRLLAAMPVTEQRLELAGISTAVLEGGDGPPVVLLHGPGEFAALWMRVIPDLVRTHSVVVPDLPGHGASSAIDGRLDADRVLSWLGELIQHTCPSPPVLVGKLLGGAIAARFAVQEGERLSHLVLVDAHGLGRFRPSPTFALALVRYVTRPSESTQERLFQKCMVDLDGLREEVGDRWGLLEAYALDRSRAPSQKAALRTLMGQFGVPPIPAAELARITVPTALIWGRHDLQVRPRIAEAASARYGWPLRVIEDAGDDSPIERPEAFLEALHGLLDPAHA
jgi:pimeloyl-ACP methyl ester carboxylesterase